MNTIQVASEVFHSQIGSDAFVWVIGISLGLCIFGAYVIAPGAPHGSAPGLILMIVWMLSCGGQASRVTVNGVASIVTGHLLQ